jgi:hypothetical protein
MTWDWAADLFGKIAYGLLAALGAALAALWVRVNGMSERIAVMEQTLTSLAKSLPDAITNLTAELKESRRDREAQGERLSEKLDDVRDKLDGKLDALRKELKDDIGRVRVN